MKITSVSRSLNLYSDHMNATVYKTIVDDKGHTTVEQTVEQVVLYSKFPIAGNGKGLYVDATV